MDHRSVEELITSTEGKINCRVWYTDGLAGYERVLLSEVVHGIGKENTQRLERTNGIIRQQTGRWHRRQNKFAAERFYLYVLAAARRSGVERTLGNMRTEIECDMKLMGVTKLDHLSRDNLRFHHSPGWPI